MLTFFFFTLAASFDPSKLTGPFPGPLTAKLAKAYGDIRGVQQEILAAQKEEDKEIDKLLPESVKYKNAPSSFIEEEPADAKPVEIDFSNLDNIQADLQKLHAKMGGDLNGLIGLKRDSEKLATQEDEDAAAAASRLHNMPSSFMEVQAEEKVDEHSNMHDDILASVQKLVATQDVLNDMTKSIVARLKSPDPEEAKLSMQDMMVLDMSAANTKALDAFKEVLSNANYGDGPHFADPESLHKFKASMDEITSHLSENMHVMNEHHRMAMREKQEKEKTFQTLMNEHYGPLLDRFIEKVESVPKLKEDEEVGRGMQALRELKDLHTKRSKLEQKAAFVHEVAPPEKRQLVDGALQKGLAALDVMFDANAKDLNHFKENVLPRVSDYIVDEAQNGTDAGPAAELADYLQSGDSVLGDLLEPFQNEGLYEDIAKRDQAKRVATSKPLEDWERGWSEDGGLNPDSPAAAKIPHIQSTSFADLTRLTGGPSAAEEGYQKLEKQLSGLHAHLQGQVARLKSEARDEAKKQVEKLDALMVPTSDDQSGAVAGGATPGAFVSENPESLLETNATAGEAGRHFRTATTA